MVTASSCVLRPGLHMSASSFAHLHHPVGDLLCRPVLQGPQNGTPPACPAPARLLIPGCDDVVTQFDRPVLRHADCVPPADDSWCTSSSPAGDGGRCGRNSSHNLSGIAYTCCQPTRLLSSFPPPSTSEQVVTGDTKDPGSQPLCVESGPGGGIVPFIFPRQSSGLRFEVANQEPVTSSLVSKWRRQKLNSDSLSVFRISLWQRAEVSEGQKKDEEECRGLQHSV